MIDNDRPVQSTLAQCGKYTFFVIGLWSGYCLLILLWPQIFAIPEIRAIVRVSVVLVPAVIYYWNGDRHTQSSYDFFLLRENWLRGVLIGGGIMVAYFLIGWIVSFRTSPTELHFPTGFATWFNFVLGSPFAEEAFFRGVLLRELQRVIGTTRAVLLSSFAFAFLHLPQWVFLSQLSGMMILSSFATIFVYGIVFALLVRITRSLWGALLPHWINNFISLSMGQ